MAEARVSQLLAQVEFSEISQVKVSQLMAQVEYNEVPPQQIVSQVLAQVEYNGIPIPKRKFPIPGIYGIYQSQWRKRLFPIEN